MMVPFCVRVLPLTDAAECPFLVCQWIETGSAWSTLLISPVAFRPGDHIRDIERPHDLETLEHGTDIVVELASFPVRLPGEIATMCIEPPLFRSPSPSSQANASSTWVSGLIVTSVVRQMNRGSPSPSSIITKSRALGIDSQPSP
jgi:hypothetical protein